MDCAVSGEPRATLAWLKDGGNDFPAARERRMHVMPEDYAFFITNAKVVDGGVYSCTAENVVGLVRTNATIVVLEAPMFVRPLDKDKEVLLGTPTVLECMTSGSPKPQLKWTKDGQPVEGVSERLYFAADDQLLVIMDSQARDAGVYECEIANELGTETGRMQLSVVAQGKTVVQAQFDSLSLIIIIAVACVLGTSIIWLVIIYHTKKSIGGGGGPRGGSTTAINNNSAAMATMLTVGDGNRVCANGGAGGEYARTSLLGNHSPLGSPVIVASGLMGPRMLNMTDGESLYMQQQPHGLIRNVSPVRVSRVDEQQLMRMRRQPEEDSRSCKDSGNGDSAKERNPTSSDEDEEVDAMLELQERQRRGGGGPISIQRNRLNEYLGDVGGVVYVEKGSVLPPVEVRGGSSSFKGSEGVVGSSSSSSGNNSSLSSNNSNVAYVGATTA